VDQYVILVAWWIGTLNWLTTGVFALASPARCARSGWPGIRRPAWSSRRVRAIGAVFTAGGVYWVFLGVHMASRMWQ
jgi:hypothetical protein